MIQMYQPPTVWRSRQRFAPNLAMALTSSIFALVGFAVLEAMKIRLYGRMLECVDEAIAYYRSASRKKRDSA